MFVSKSNKEDATKPPSLQKQISELMGHSNMTSDDTSSTEDEQEKAHHKWVCQLPVSMAGQKFLDHLSHLEAAPQVKTSSAFEQALAFRRVFMHALSKSKTPFGIPKKMPKFIAIVNFSGDRLLLYSSNPSLITLLAVSATQSTGAFEGINQIVSHAISDDSCSVLMCYALPFQMGADAAFWECRLLRKTGSGIDDGELVCNIWDRQASSGVATSSSESQRVEILDAQVEAFRNSIQACDLDVTFEKVDGVEPETSVDEKQSKLLSMVAMLQNERRKMLVDHKTELAELKNKHLDEMQKTAEVLKASFDKQNEDGSRLDNEVKESKVEIQMLRSEIAKKNEEIQQLKSDAMIKDETNSKVQAANAAKTSELQRELQTLKSQSKRNESDFSESLKKKDHIYRQMQDEAERKLQMARQSDDAAAQSFIKLKTMEQAFENASNEKCALVSQLEESKQKLHGMRFRLAIQFSRNETLHDMMREARLNHAKCEERVQNLTQKCTEESERMQQGLSEAKEACALKDEQNKRLETEVCDLKLQLEEPVGQTSLECTETAIQTDILQETLQIGELENECVKLRDEVSALKTELLRLRSKTNKRGPPPASFLPETPIAENHNSGLDTKVITQDSVLEGTIRQLYLSLNTITDLARQCKTNEQSARDAQTKLHAYETMAPTHHANPQQAVFPMQYMYQPVHNGQVIPFS